MSSTIDAKQSYAYRRGLSPNTLSVLSAKNRVFAVSSKGSALTDKNNGIKSQVGVMSQFDPSENRSVETVRGIGFGDKIAELVPGATEAMSISVNRTAQYLENTFQAFGFKGGVDGMVRSLRHHRWPFDIRQEVVMSQYVAEQAFGVESAGTSSAAPSYASGTWAGDATAAPGEGSTGIINNGSDEKAFLGYATGVSYTDGSGGVSGKYDDTDPDKFFIDDTLAVITVYEACWFTDFSVSYSADSALVQENCTLQVSDVVAIEGQSFGYDEDTGGKLSSERMQGFRTLKPQAA